MTLVSEPDAAASSALFAVDTHSQDATRASLRVAGRLDAETVELVAATADAHLAIGRRYLRIDLNGVTALTRRAVIGLRDIHRQALTRRGTVVYTGTRPGVAAQFANSAPELFWLSRSADDARENEVV